MPPDAAAAAGVLGRAARGVRHGVNPNIAIVSNTPEALRLSEEIFVARPSTLLRVHTRHRDGFPLFFGESSMHILCVNQQEELLCRMLAMLCARVAPAQLSELLRSQATGLFFEGEPRSSIAPRRP